MDDEVPIEWFLDLLRLIHETPNLDWLLLTKRPELWRARVERALIFITDGTGKEGEFWQWVLEWLHEKLPGNIWIGVSVEDQQRADERIPELLKIPARIRFLSVEPMLSPVDLQYATFNGADSLSSMEGIHWVIFGGESGANARPCDVNWIRNGIKQCLMAGVAPFVKQLGSDPYCSPQHDGATGFKMSLKDKKGGDMSEWPIDVRIREFPPLEVVK